MTEHSVDIYGVHKYTIYKSNVDVDIQWARAHID